MLVEISSGKKKCNPKYFDWLRYLGGISSLDKLEQSLERSPSGQVGRKIDINYCFNGDFIE